MDRHQSNFERGAPRAHSYTLGRRSRRHDPLYRIRRLPLMGAERLDDDGWEKLAVEIDAGDPTEHLAAAWIAKEELRCVYHAPDERAVRRALSRFYLHCADHDDVAEVYTLATTISA